MTFFYIRAFIFLIFLALMTACSAEDQNSSHNGGDDHGDEHHRLTHWEGDVELFAEFEIHENSGRIEGDLFVAKGHRPAGNVTGTLFFRADGSRLSAQELEKREDGVFPFELHFQDYDTPELVALLTIDGEEMEVLLGAVDRYAGEAEHDDSLAELEKRMQWQLSLESSPADYHQIPDVIDALGRVMYDPAYFREVISPVDGRIDSDQIINAPVSGTRVSEGDPLVGISPSLDPENSWTELQLAYRQAEAAYKRAKRLFENDAMSLGEYQVREREYEIRKAGYEHFIDSGRLGAHAGESEDKLFLSAYRAGVIGESFVVGGRNIRRGDPLFTIYHPDHLWLEVLGYRDEMRSIPEIIGVELLLNRSEHVTLNSNQFRTVSRDLRSDESGSRTSVILSIDNREGLLSVNQPVRVRLKGDDENRVLAAPNEAIFDDDSHKVIFIMVSGDQFERRTVLTGSSYGGYTAIMDGLEEGERVVTKGTYPLHLMTGNVQIDDDHDH